MSDPNTVKFTEGDFSNARPPKYQRKFEPFLEQEKEGVAKDKSKRKRTFLQCMKNTPSKVNIMGSIDSLYHQLPAELLGQEAASQRQSEEDRWRQQVWRKTPLKLHHPETKCVLDNEQSSDSDEEHQDMNIIMAVTTKKGALRKKLENRIQKLDELLQYKEYKIVKREEELCHIKQLRDVTKAIKKHKKVPLYSPVMKQTELSPSLFCTGDRRNTLTGSVPLRIAHPGDSEELRRVKPLLKALDENGGARGKRKFESSYNTQAPYCVDQGEKIPTRRLPKTHITHPIHHLNCFVSASVENYNKGTFADSAILQRTQSKRNKSSLEFNDSEAELPAVGISRTEAKRLVDEKRNAVRQQRRNPSVVLPPTDVAPAVEG